MDENPYKVLSVSQTASSDEIRNAYRALAKKLHPDLNPGNKQAEAKFKNINAAYEKIGMPEARAKFDRGEVDEAESRTSRGPANPFYHQTQQNGGRYSQPFEGMDEELFQNIFGKMGGSRREENLKGQDILYKMDIEFKESILGGQREITLGSGKRLNVKIPVGVSSGAKLRFPGYGQPGVGKASAGDAYVELGIRPSSLFKRSGNDLEIELPISFSEAILGASVPVPTIDGSVVLTIPSGVSSGSKLRVKGKGVPKLGDGSRGDQYVVVKVIIPQEVDEDLKKAIADWNQRESFNARKGWVGSPEESV